MSGLAALLPDPIKSVLRPMRNAYLKYFSEVGYVTRQIHRLDSCILQFPERRRRHLLARRIAPLNAFQENVVRQLNVNGFCKVTLDELHINRGVLDYLAQLSKPYEHMSFEQVKAASPGEAKYYWMQMNNNSAADTVVYDALTRNKFLIDILGRYFGEIPYFDHFRYLYSPVFPNGQTYLGSQNWHRDNHHKKVLKLFFSPFTLTKNEGPTQLLPSRLSTRKYYTGYPRYMTDEELFKTGVTPVDQVYLTGEPGTVYLVDTARCLHCGSRSNGASRHIAIATFTSTDRYIARENAPKAQTNIIESINQAMLEMYEHVSA